MALDPEERSQQINARLKAGMVGISIQRRGDRLCLREIPPRPGSTKNKPFSQEIYLGIFCNSAGFTSAENEAKLVGSLLAKREFSWEPYLHTKKSQTHSFAATALLLSLWDKYVEQKSRSVSITTINKDFKKVRNHLIVLTDLRLESAMVAARSAKHGRRAYRLRHRNSGLPAGNKNCKYY